MTGVSSLPARHAEFLTVELPSCRSASTNNGDARHGAPVPHLRQHFRITNYWEALLKTKTDEARPPRRGSRECNALERELRRIVREKLLVALDNAVGYGLDALEPHVTHALACAAAEDDAAAAALLASSRAMRDARASDDAQYDPLTTRSRFRPYRSSRRTTTTRSPCCGGHGRPTRPSPVGRRHP